ncbi:hypothetical protein [Burkholderia sp. AU32262]|uniref:hypothetical protein n=1 Tax=Burkholderia sp. AU32262 TaxID=2879630 RepID=UPI001CF10D69|nr:hypothetical protein [Burkholderia sp. AU32262]MCA8244151.1 hypothetical protein [Burkholderia sp. AU32262]
MEKLRDHRPLGVFSDGGGYFRSEYQIGKRLVWVRCRHRLDCLECVGKADEILADIWAAMPDAIALAEDYSRTEIPDFWSMHDMSKREGARLDVWGITTTPDLGEARFDISRNYNFDYLSPTFFKDDYWNEEPVLLPELPDRYHVYLIRNRSGQLSVAIDSLNRHDGP